jgi:hypothetical protein
MPGHSRALTPLAPKPMGQSNGVEARAGAATISIPAIPTTAQAAVVGFSAV